MILLEYSEFDRGMYAVKSVSNFVYIFESGNF